MDSLYWKKDMSVYNTFIIRMKNNDLSNKLAERCAASCERVGQSYSYWDAYDGTQGEKIEIPEHHSETMSMIKVTNHYLTRAEVACALSHISLWIKCVVVDMPIVILEHDSIMLQPYNTHRVYNSICYLGCAEQAKKNWTVSSIPPHASDGPNFHFICRAHAYAIDPMVAKNMVAYVLKMGIHSSLDMLLRADLFPIHQIDLFAYDDYYDTTIKGRPKNGRNIIKNDFLKV